MTARPTRIHEEVPTLPEGWRFEYQESKDGPETFCSVLLLTPWGYEVGSANLIYHTDPEKGLWQVWIRSHDFMGYPRLSMAMDALASMAWLYKHPQGVPAAAAASLTPVTLRTYMGFSPKVWRQVAEERLRQVKRWGAYRNLPLGDESLALVAHALEALARDQMDRGRVSFASILAEEVREALRESNPERIREELVQVAAVCIAALEEASSEVLDDVHEPIPHEIAPYQEVPDLGLMDSNVIASKEGE